MAKPNDAELIALAHTIQAHLTATCAFINSIGSEFGWGGLGAFASHMRFLNPAVVMHLEDAADLFTCRDGKPAPTLAARRMTKFEHGRNGRRLSPMPPASRQAVLIFLAERVTLFEQADALLRARNSSSGMRCTAWQLRRLTKLQRRLEHAWARDVDSQEGETGPGKTRRPDDRARRRRAHP